MLSRAAQRKPGIPLNILLIRIDSSSDASARRKLPKVYKYLKDELGAMIFNGQSIVGDGTTEQMTVMLIFCHCVLYLLDPAVISANHRRRVREGDFTAIFGTSVPIPSLNTTEKITDEFIEMNI